MSRSTKETQEVRCRNPDGHPEDQEYREYLFRCPACGEQVCGICEGGCGEDFVPEVDALCDDCWQTAKSVARKFVKAWIRESKRKR